MKRLQTFLLLALFAACSTPHRVVDKPVTADAANILNTNITSQGKLFAGLFQQSAAEYRALCYQAFNIAKLRVDEYIKTQHTLPAAIITDIDETVLDNSPYDIKRSLQGKDYEQKSWAEWTALGIADSVPGAPSFLKYAASKGIQIFYITNRLEEERTGTLKNLQRFNLPNADDEHLILKQNVSSKEQRRQDVMKTHTVVLLMGDNLTDFSALYDKKLWQDRKNATDQLVAEFGNRFIVLPNPSYGDWETALYNYNYNLSPAQKDSVFKSRVKSY